MKEVYVTNNELVLLIQSRAEKLLDLQKGRPQENKNKLESVQKLIDELKKRLEE